MEAAIARCLRCPRTSGRFPLHAGLLSALDAIVATVEDQDRPMTAAEASAIMEQPLPKYFAAIAGNPFQGMGIGIKHTDRWSAEASRQETSTETETPTC